ncbi:MULTISPECIES: LD-carboxypeptidase [unclassified Streptomyces]|uniref:S66 peptidase family protein n=1 Tax=unclassified Streptomyces TaxID=2593676 RepID=UPI0034261C2E
MTSPPGAAPTPAPGPDAVRALTRPPRLRPGDRVAVVAPSGPPPPERLEAGLRILRDWGLDPVALPRTPAAHRGLAYLAGEDRLRAQELTEAWCDPAFAAVLSARGGYGAQRMVDLVDWDAVRAAPPKPFVGYSDATALHEAFAVRAGVATLHGPMPATEAFLTDAAARASLHTALFDPERARVVEARSGARAMVPGRARGTTLGGCLALLAADLGVPGARTSARGGLLLLEDVGEDDYRIDRLLTQLLRADWLTGVAGVLLGSWADCGRYEEVRAVLLDRLAPLGVPVVEEFGFGHGPGALTVPLGVPALLDADACRLVLDVAPLR